MILYLVKSGLCLMVLLGVYHFVLGREKMYRFNRYFLLLSLAFGLLIPLNTIERETTPILETTTLPTASTIAEQPIAILSEATEYFTLENSILAIYLFITAVFLVRFAKNLLTIFTKIRQSKKMMLPDYTLVLLPEKTLPYTFLSYIFINEDDFNHDKIEDELLDHEKAHVQQHHSYDILFIELLQVFFWFQPALYGFKSALQFNHEFLADEAVLQKAVPAENYQNLILTKISPKKPVPFSSNLAYFVTKKRFIMMTKHTSALKSSLLKLAVLPLLVGLTASFSTYEEMEILPVSLPQKTTLVPTAENKTQNQEIPDAEYFAGVRLNVYKYYDKTDKKLKDKIFSKTYEELTAEDLKAYGKWFKVWRQKPLEKKSPSEKELHDFKNSKKYAIWIDGVNVPNTKLNQYKPSDFAHFSGSVILKNARTKKHPQPFQYWFHTQTYYEKNKMGEPLKKYPGDKIDITINSKKVEPTSETPIQESKNPDYPGGLSEFMKYFGTTFNYPNNLKITEPLRLVAYFNVTKDGTLSDIKISKGHSPEVDNEIIRVLKASPKWIPGEKDGKKVDAQMTLPILLQPK